MTTYSSDNQTAILDSFKDDTGVAGITSHLCA